ncbi:MAG: Hsp20/alpha crystallin family protein [Lachnospiraceae bacterium]|nr:Hsp20/alpha crystallin family protein [Lachnospiraceae bacterium]
MLLPNIFGENLLDDWMSFPTVEFPEVNRKLYGSRSDQIMKTDVHEHENGYELDIDLPGFKKDEIKLSLENGYLAVSAAKGLDKEEKDDKGKLIRQERYSGSMQRSFYVGDILEEEDIKAKFEDGVLRLSIPKKDTKKVPEKKYIAIEG